MTRESSNGRSQCTVVLNQDRIVFERHARGMSQKEFAAFTDRGVRVLAKKERDEGLPKKFWPRLMQATRMGVPAGICEKSVSNIERGKPVYLVTAMIVAASLDIPLRELIVSEAA